MVPNKNTHTLKNSNQPMSTDLYEQLQKDILVGKLRQNSKLTEKQICDKYNVSRTPVREALMQLSIDGLVETIPNRGAFVSGLKDQDYRDMFRLRELFEVQAVIWAISRISEDEMIALEETFEFMEFYTMKKDTDKMLKINSDFHSSIYNASHDKILIHTLNTFKTYIRYTNINRKYEDDYLSTVLREHRQIFNAFAENDQEAGAAAMAMHLSNAKKRYGI